MPFVSQILGKPVRDASGQKVGKLVDLAVAFGRLYPSVSAILVSQPGNKRLGIPASQVSSLEPDNVGLSVTTPQIKPRAVAEDELLIVRDVLDKQIIDTEGVKVVRVNDVQITRVNGGYHVLAVDHSARGLLRRIGLGGAGDLFHLPDRSIKWEDVELVPSDGAAAVKLKVPRGQLAELHPADIAQIVQELSIAEGSNTIATFDDETAARVAAEMDTERQVAIMERMDSDRVADIVEEMSPDDAVDLLAEMDEKKAQEIIGLMEPEAAEDVKELIGYEEDSAGGIMTTEFLAFRPDLTAEQVIDRLREMAPDPESVMYLYVTDAEEHLLGVLPLRDLIIARPQTRVGDIMLAKVISVDVDSPQVDVAKILAKYNLLALPVVDKDNRLIGMVTVDDVMDVVLPRDWRTRKSKVAV
ncbi:MAG: CBS domain-containing protein [Bacteroidetes bacterium]|nr:CBS domain-containing protein [Bacteroidota bacterium]MCL5027012.1 CBS domain-containing protein [Chloroflexota bacterium]